MVRSPGTPVTSEQQLMRLSDDPLLVRDFIQRLDPAGPLVRTIPSMRAEATLALAGTAATKTGAVGGSDKEQRYEAPPSRDEGSVFPFAFRPTAEDRKSALLHSDPVGMGSVQAGRGFAPAAATFIMLIFILLITLQG